MAKVTIVIQDSADGDPEVTALFEPPANDGISDDTPAQAAAKAVLIVMAEAMGGYGIETESGG